MTEAGSVKSFFKEIVAENDRHLEPEWRTPYANLIENPGLSSEDLESIASEREQRDATAKRIKSSGGIRVTKSGLVVRDMHFVIESEKGYSPLPEILELMEPSAMPGFGSPGFAAEIARQHILYNGSLGYGTPQPPLRVGRRGRKP